MIVHTIFIIWIGTGPRPKNVHHLTPAWWDVSTQSSPRCLSGVTTRPPVTGRLPFVVGCRSQWPTGADIEMCLPVRIYALPALMLQLWQWFKTSGERGWRDKWKRKSFFSKTLLFIGLDIKTFYLDKTKQLAHFHFDMERSCMRSAPKYPPMTSAQPHKKLWCCSDQVQCKHVYNFFPNIASIVTRKWVTCSALLMVIQMVILTEECTSLWRFCVIFWLSKFVFNHSGIIHQQLFAWITKYMVKKSLYKDGVKCVREQREGERERTLQPRSLISYHVLKDSLTRKSASGLSQTKENTTKYEIVVALVFHLCWSWRKYVVCRNTFECCFVNGDHHHESIKADGLSDRTRHTNDSSLAQPQQTTDRFILKMLHLCRVCDRSCLPFGVLL